MYKLLHSDKAQVAAIFLKENGATHINGVFVRKNNGKYEFVDNDGNKLLWLLAKGRVTPGSDISVKPTLEPLFFNPKHLKTAINAYYAYVASPVMNTSISPKRNAHN